MTSCTEPSLPSLRAQTLGVLLCLALAACASPGPRRSPAPTIPPATASHAASTPSADKGDPEVRFQEALALMKGRRHAEAQAAFLALTRDFPELSGPQTDLGILYAQARQHDLAIASLERAVKANPANAVAHNWLGTLHREKGDLLGAEQDYRRAIAARPDYAPAWLNLAILYDVALHRPREALATYQEYQRKFGQDDLIVAAWIRDLEARLQAAPAVRTASMQGAAP